MSRYQPYLDASSEKRKDIPNGNWSDVKRKCLFLKLSLLRYYREEGKADKWEICIQDLKKHESDMHAELKEVLAFEKCMQHLFRYEVKNLKAALEQWDPSESAPFFQAKRAALLAEIGQREEAEHILQAVLHNVRLQMNLKPITNDYSLPSQEAHILQLLKSVKDSLSLRGAISFSKRPYVQEYNQRWNKLRQYKCDPWNELKLFTTKLRATPEKLKSVEEVYSYDLGESSNTIHLAITDKELRVGISFLRYIEDIGLPLRLHGASVDKKATVGAIARVGKDIPNWANATLLRLGDAKSVDILFSRDGLTKMTMEQADSISEVLIKIMQEVHEDILEVDGWHDGNIGTHYAAVVPEVMSRLCSKNSEKMLDRVLEFLIQVYRQSDRHKYENIEKLAKRLTKSWPKNRIFFLIKEIIEKIPVSKLDVNDEINFPDPLKFLLGAKWTCEDGQEIERAVVEDLLQRFSETEAKNRESYFYRLAFLFEKNLLKDKQAKIFSRLLWGKVDETGFPYGLRSIYRTAFLKLPYPISVKLEERINAYISAIKFEPIHPSIFGMGRSIHRPFWELIYAEPFLERIRWNSENAESTFQKIVSWCEQSITVVLTEKTSEQKKRELKTSVFLAGRAVGSLCLRFLPSSWTEQNGRVDRFLEKLAELDMPTGELRAARIICTPGLLETQLKSISNEVLSNDLPTSVSAVKGIVDILSKDIENFKSNQHKIVAPLMEAIKWRQAPALIEVLVSLPKVMTLPWFDWHKYLDDVLVGLKYLIDESDLSKQNGNIPVNQRLLVRMWAAKLACFLYVELQAKGTHIPEVIENWKAICTDTREFAEIRNQWVDKMQDRSMAD